MFNLWFNVTARLASQLLEIIVTLVISDLFMRLKPLLFCMLIFSLESFQEIKYAAYRTAMKLRAIQKLTHSKDVTAVSSSSCIVLYNSEWGSASRNEESSLSAWADRRLQ